MMNLISHAIAIKEVFGQKHEFRSTKGRKEG